MIWAENGQTFYEAEFLLNEQEVEIKAAADDTLLSKEIDDDKDN